MTRSAPMIPPLTTRMVGVMKLLSKAYFTKKTTPRNKARPPIQAKSFTPRIDSQFIGVAGAGRVMGAIGSGGGEVGGGGAGGDGNGPVTLFDVMAGACGMTPR